MEKYLYRDLMFNMQRHTNPECWNRNRDRERKRKYNSMVSVAALNMVVCVIVFFCSFQ